MAPEKRKSGPTNESFARSKKVGGNDDRPMKRLRQDDAPAAAPSSAKSASTAIHVPKISKLKEEEQAFPRGGASVLTPLEHKQINIDATRDVLFEQEAASKAPEGTAPAKRKGPKPRKKKGEDTKPEEEEDVVRIEEIGRAHV